MAYSLLYIVMPIYNASATLPRAVSSLWCISASNRQRVHLIGIDDGSTDDSATVFSQAAVAVEGLNWNLIRRKNGGSGAARNAGLKSFSAGWTIFLDADDELVADPFPSIDHASDSTALLFDAEYHRDGKPLFTIPVRRPDNQRLAQMFSERSPYCTLSIIFRRELLDCLFSEDLRFLEDWYFLATNPGLFARCTVHRGVAIGTVHGGKESKSADQYKNGYYRVIVADRLAAYWADERNRVVDNNLAIQRAIGKIQMGEPVPLKILLSIPASLSLYAKLLIYRFAFRLYLRLYPYA